MANSYQEALTALVNRLRNSGCEEVASEITRVIGRGETEEVELRGRGVERSQRPLRSEEAYLIALELVIAHIEPVLMKEHAENELGEVSGAKPSLVWCYDFVENSPVAPDEVAKMSFPEGGVSAALERNLKVLVDLMGTI